ncbi:MAG: glycosyltransferase family 1 protein [Candidatus Paceibacterota bacterium]
MTEEKKIKIALMSYAVDGRPSSGSALYARQLISRLVLDSCLECYLIHYETSDDPIYKMGAKEIVMPKVKLPYGSHFISQLLFFWQHRKQKFDIIHWFQPRLYPFFWLAPARKIVVTMHGGGMIAFKQKFIFSNFMFNFILSNFGFKVDIAFADTDFGKREIIDNYKIDNTRLKVVHMGGGELFKAINKEEARNLIVSKYNIKAPFILDISRLQPHKNIDSLIRAYILVRNSGGVNQKLVIVGTPVQDYKKTYEIARESLYKDDIFFVNFVPQEDLNAFYSAADLFVFPSLNEGFGVPVVEAMASGTPVITSNTTALPEVAGDAAVLVDPLNIKQIAYEMNRILSDNNFKKGLIKKGLERAKQFTWDKTTEYTKKTYFDLTRY